MIQTQVPFIMSYPVMQDFVPMYYPMVYQQPIQCPAPKQIQQKPQSSKKVTVKGTWSIEEDKALRDAVSKSQPIMWDVVAKSVVGRTPKQCRERWMYRLHPELKKTPFEKWEDELIFEQKRKIGNKWTQIALQLPGRTSCSVKNRWYTVLRNKYSNYLDSQSSDNSSSHSQEDDERNSALSIETLLNH